MTARTSNGSSSRSGTKSLSSHRSIASMLVTYRSPCVTGALLMRRYVHQDSPGLAAVEVFCVNTPVGVFKPQSLETIRAELKPRSKTFVRSCWTVTPSHGTVRCMSIRRKTIERFNIAKGQRRHDAGLLDIVQPNMALHTSCITSGIILSIRFVLCGRIRCSSEKTTQSSQD